MNNYTVKVITRNSKNFGTYYIFRIDVYKQRKYNDVYTVEHRNGQYRLVTSEGQILQHYDDLSEAIFDAKEETVGRLAEIYHESKFDVTFKHGRNSVTHHCNFAFLTARV